MKENEKKCELCGDIFEVNLKNKRSRNKRFCSGICAKRFNGLNNKGRKHTEEWKREMSAKNMGENNPFFGKKHNNETLNKISKSNRWGGDKYRYCNMTQQEREIFDGIMISDGSLSNSRISARITLGFKYKETLERISSDLGSLRFSNILEYKSKPHKKTSKSYINYYMKSAYYHDLLEYYHDWYNDNIKRVPINIKITSLMCYWWYICDGFILDDNVYLCTDSFDLNDLELLKNKFEEIDFDVSIRKNKRIFFNKKDSLNFLRWISDDVNIQEEYLYKWKMKNNNL